MILCAYSHQCDPHHFYSLAPLLRQWLKVKTKERPEHYTNEYIVIWRDEFIKKWESISEQGFDLNFKRMWNFYLSYCEAGFKSKNIDLIQFSLSNK